MNARQRAGGAGCRPRQHLHVVFKRPERLETHRAPCCQVTNVCSAKFRHDHSCRMSSHFAAACSIVLKNNLRRTPEIARQSAPARR